MAFPYVRANADWKNASSATGGGDTSTPLNEAALDTIEAGIESLSDILELANAEGDLLVASGADAWTRLAEGADDEVLSVNAGSLDYRKIVNAMVDAAAAIAVSKLAASATAGDVLTTVAGTATWQAPAAGGVDWAIMFGAASNEPPASAFATLDTRNSHPVLDFDAATDESAVFRGVLHPGYANSGVNVRLIWAASTATSGNVIWEVSFERVNAGALDIDADSFATAVTASAAADSVSGETTETTIAVSNGASMDSLVAGEMFRLKVTRDANHASDTMTGDAELIAIVVTEQ